MGRMHPLQDFEFEFGVTSSGRNLFNEIDQANANPKGSSYASDNFIRNEIEQPQAARRAKRMDAQSNPLVRRSLTAKYQGFFNGCCLFAKIVPQSAD